MPHYDFRDGKFVEIPIEPSHEKSIAREQGITEGFASGFNVGLRFGELFGHPLELTDEAATISLATLYRRARYYGVKTGTGSGFRRATFGTVVALASGFSGTDAAVDLNFHKIEDSNNLLAFSFEPSGVHVDNGEVVTLPVGIDDAVETSRLLAKVATEFLSPIEGFSSIPLMAEPA